MENAINPLGQNVIAKIAEMKIEEAIQDGEFDHLPGFGKPFEFDMLEYDPNWWIKQKMRRERLCCKIGTGKTPDHS